MTDYREIKKHCETRSELTARVIDRRLLYHAALRNGVDRQFDARIHRFRHVTGGLPAGAVARFKSQYIAHRIFRKEGLIHRYLKQSFMGELPGDESAFLHTSSKTPWRFSFSMLEDGPAKDFHSMFDVFTGETFLLFSPTMSREMSENPMIRLWLNLILFNGMCWQTYGPVVYFQSFDADDIFFFSTELDPSIDTDESLQAGLEENPVPYMMLVNGSRSPLIFDRDKEVHFVKVECACDRLDTEKLSDLLKVECSNGVHRFLHPVWSSGPHFAECFFDESARVLMLTATTMEGFLRMREELMRLGVELPEEPTVAVHPGMVSLAGSLLKREINVNPYAGLFSVSSDSVLGDVSHDRFIEAALACLTNGLEPNLESMARDAGIPIDAAKSIYASMSAMHRKMRSEFGSGDE